MSSALRYLRDRFQLRFFVKPLREAKRPILKIEPLEDRALPSGLTLPHTLTVGQGRQYATISAALTAAPANTTIDVCPGVYTQPLVIAQSGISLVAEGAVTVQPAAVAPVVLNGVNVGGAAIDVYGANDSIAGFTVDGSKDADGNLWAGIRVIDGGSATIENNTVENIASGPADANIGIQVGDALVPGPAGGGAATVTGNTVRAYAGAGILVDGASSTATVQSNTITGRGTGNKGVSEYGIQVSDGAAGQVRSNTLSCNTISGAVAGGYNPSPASAGIYFYNDGGTASSATGNTATGNDDGILVQQSSGASARAGIPIENNVVQQNYGYAGILVLASNNVEIQDNTVKNNSTWNGIALNQSSGVQVSFNTVTKNCNADGVYDYRGTDNAFVFNSADSNGNNGINIDTSTGDLLMYNATSDNAYNGVQVTGGSGTAIWLGLSSGNDRDGVLVTNTVGAQVIGNLLTTNSGSGLALVNAQNTVVAIDVELLNAGGTIASTGSSGTQQLGRWPPTPQV